MTRPFDGQQSHPPSPGPASWNEPDTWISSYKKGFSTLSAFVDVLLRTLDKALLNAGEYSFPLKRALYQGIKQALALLVSLPYALELCFLYSGGSQARCDWLRQCDAPSAPYPAQHTPIQPVVSSPL